MSINLYLAYIVPCQYPKNPPKPCKNAAPVPGIAWPILHPKRRRSIPRYRLFLCAKMPVFGFGLTNGLTNGLTKHVKKRAIEIHIVPEIVLKSAILTGLRGAYYHF
jgi:hypothetical protein